MTKIDIQHQDQLGKWRHLQTKPSKVMRTALLQTVLDPKGNAIDWRTKTETFWM